MAIRFYCTCGFEMRAADAHAGLHGRCSACGEVVKVPGDLAQAPTPVAVSAPPVERKAPVAEKKRLTTKYALFGSRGGGQAESPVSPSACIPAAGSRVPAAAVPPHVQAPGEAGATVICAACGDAAPLAQTVACIHCHADHHRTCWLEKGGCSVPTCAAGPRSRRHVIHARGQEERLKPCPVCAELIPERAQRCRYCGEFTDAGLRQASKKRFRFPHKTSYRAGTSLILGLVSIVMMGLLAGGPLMCISVCLPVAAISTSISAMRDIHRSAGEKSGWWMAGAGLALGAISLLSWLVSVL